MSATPDEIEDVLNQMREKLLLWHSSDTLGELVVLRGGNEYQLFERGEHKFGTVKRKSRRAGYVERVGQA